MRPTSIISCLMPCSVSFIVRYISYICHLILLQGSDMPLCLPFPRFLQDIPLLICVTGRYDFQPRKRNKNVDVYLMSVHESKPGRYIRQQGNP